MSEPKQIYRIFISAAEPSADAHCAGLITALKKSDYNLEFVGVGGDKMADAGCRLLETTTANAAMIYNAFTQIGRYVKLIRKIKKFFQSNKVDLVIVCDSPAFNFHVAKAAKKCGIKTLFYVAPQLWAWGSWRIKKLKNCCDKLACILPFEQQWFRDRGVDAAFVGNPLFDELDENLADNKKDYADFDAKHLKLALMPGSRPAEISSLWRPMQQIAIRLKRKCPKATFIAVAADNKKKEILQASHIPSFKCYYTVDSVHSQARQADFVIVASGSATLQVAAAGCPMAIMYQSSKFMWHTVGRWLLKTKHLSLVNILAQKELAPEFMPYFTSIDPIVSSVEGLIDSRTELAKLSGNLIDLVEPLSRTSAAEKTAQLVIEMLS